MSVAIDRAALARRNALLMIIEGALFWAGLSFLEGNTVVSVFMERSTGSTAMAGLASTLRQVMYLLGQFIVGMFIHRIRVQRRFMVIMAFICRPLILLMLPALLGGVTGMGSVVLFLGIYSLFFLTDGFVAMCWNQVCIRTLPLGRRGEVLSLQQTFAGLIGIAAGFALRSILGGPLSTGQQFSIIFGLAGFFLVVDALVMSRIEDVPHASEPDRQVPSLPQYIAQFLPLLRENRTVRRVLLARALYLMTLISAPLNILFGVELGGLNTAQQATLVFMPVLGQVAAGLLWARLSRRKGYPVVMLLAQCIGVAGAAASFVCLGFVGLGWPVFIPLSVTMVLIGVNTPAYQGFFQHMCACVEEEKRALIMVLASIVLTPLAFGPYLAGVLCEWAGYAPVYGIMLAMGLAGLWVTWDSFFSHRSMLPVEHRHNPG